MLRCLAASSSLSGVPGRADPCDNQIIRFSNCMQCAAMICRCAAIVIRELQDAADIMTCLADCVYYTTAGCMLAQVRAVGVAVALNAKASLQATRSH